jgi:hypothetical protein
MRDENDEVTISGRHIYDGKLDLSMFCEGRRVAYSRFKENQ